MSTIYYKTLITGGTGAALDSIDEDDLYDGDLAIIVQDMGAANITRTYVLDEDSGLSEDSPDVITPDGATGNKRWVLLTSFGRDIIGFFRRAQFTYVDSDTITISPGSYHLSGTEERVVFWDSDITFDFGSGGSNSDSDDLAASDWFYVYLDDSAIETGGSNELTASEFVDSTTEPTWSDSKQGWYNGNDRCIFAVLTDGSSNILEFFHESNFVLWADSIEELSETDIDTSWQDITLEIPVFSREVQTWFRSQYVDGACTGKWRTNGQTGSDGHYLSSVDNDSHLGSTVQRVITDSSGKIEVKHSASNGNTMAVHSDGWYFSKGL